MGAKLLTQDELRKLPAILGLRSILVTTEAIGQRLRRLRRERGMTQRQIAGPYTAGYVSQVESGRKVPSSAALRQFADCLGVSLKELTEGVPADLEPEIRLRLQEGWQAMYLGRFDQARKAFVACERDARPFRFEALRARALVGRAWCAERQGQTADAMELFVESRRVFEESCPTPAAAEAVAGIARCHQLAGSTRVALHVLETYLLDLKREDLPDPTALMRTYASLVWPYCELGLWRQAGEAAENALRLQGRVQEPEEIAGMHVNVARVLLGQGRTDYAMCSLEKAEEIYRDLNWQTEIARAQTSKGIVLLERGDLGAARSELEAALHTFRGVGFAREEGRTLNELARLSRLLGDLEAAEALAQQALELLSEMEAVPELALAHRELALIIRQDDPSTAVDHFTAAIELYERCGEATHAADTYRLLGELLETEDDPAASKEAYHAGLRLIAQGLDRAD